MSEEQRLREYLRKATAELQLLRGRYRELDQRLHEPIAIVGMSCRLPGGVASPEDLWLLLERGGDAIGAFPTDRGWDLGRLRDDPDRAGFVAATEGGFLSGLGEFDPEFFGISPREALAMNPQQRLVLELGWEALESAGLDPEALRGERVGTFTGVFHDDYHGNAVRASGSAESEHFASTSDATCVVSGRLAYSFGLEGPAVSIDTACSSSLVALHLACHSLREGECRLALAGGVTTMSTPMMLAAFSRQGAVSADGRCRSYGAGAEGTGFSEGAGLLVLERLSDAEAKGHRPLALIRGSAVNQDGASNGLTAPNGPSQERVIRQALASAGISAADVDAVEGHGTGTALGDPIEAQALLATYGADRGGSGPLRLGSIKSNIGHTSAAAGVAGVIKMVQALRQEVLPRSLHCEEPSPHVDWSAGEVELLSGPVDWARGERVRRAGVSSFGISGTNAHLILEEAPAEAEVEVEEQGEAPHLPALPFLVSARGEEGLRAQAEALADWAGERVDLALPDLAHSLTLRPRLTDRAAVLASSREELVAGLGALAAGEPASAVVAGRALQGRTAFLLTGQGAQWPGMGRGLCEAFPVFDRHLTEVCTELDRHLGRPLREIVLAAEGSEEAALLGRTDLTQPALFALEVALARLLAGLGVSPDALLGHSVGEIVAVHLAGALPLEDAALLVCERGRLMASLPGGGAMLAVETTEEELLDSLAEGTGLAAVNAPRAVVASGPAGEIEELEALWRDRGARTRRLAVGHAFHSALMEPILGELEEVAASLSWAAPRVPVISDLTGLRLSAEEIASPSYWSSQARSAVRFADGVGALRDLGVSRFLEVGPAGVLAAAARLSLPDEDRGRLLIAASMRPGREEAATLLSFLAEAHCHGEEVDWAPLLPAGAKRVGLPTYAFTRRRYWLEASAAPGDLAAAGQRDPGHPLLAAMVPTAGEPGGFILTGRLSLSAHPWLKDHAVAGQVLLPGTAFLELALAAARETGCEGVEELALLSPLLLPEQGARELQVRVAPPGEEGGRAIEIHSRPAGGEGEEEWDLHASGLLAAEVDPLPSAEETGIPPEGAREVGVEDLYGRLAGRGYEYGPAFRGLHGARHDVGMDGWWGEVSLPEAAGRGGEGFCLHPALADAALHTMLLAALEGEEEGEGEAAPRVPFSFAGVTVTRPGASSLRVSLRTEGDSVSLTATGEDGGVVARIGSLRSRAIDPAALRQAAGGAAGDLLTRTWVGLPGGPVEGTPTLALLGGGDHPAGLEGALHPDLASLARAIAAGEPAPGPVLCPLDPGEGSPAEELHALTARALEVVQAFLDSPELSDSRLVILTRGALAVGEEEAPDVSLAGAVGLLRVAASENPGRIALIDLDPADPGTLPAAALSSTEPETAVRGGVLLAPRLGRAGGAGTPPEGPWHLTTSRPGTLESLELSSDPPRPLAEGEVRVAVRAAGLNFRDVLIALGHYPGEAELGSEGSGVVAGLGPGVEGLAVGDRVTGLLEGAFGPMATTDARLLAPVPAGWSWAEAAAVPIAYLTAYYALFDLAGLQPGERVLIHGAAGGVGTAAMQLARHAGAEVLATAHPDKWDELRRRGLSPDRTASSRDTGFRDRFLEETDGRGVDVVLDSLAGEMVDASLDLLPRGGRFVEIGKTDIRDAAEVATGHPGVAYRAFDLMEAGPGRLGEMLAEVLSLFEAGALAHPPVTIRDLRRAEGAFRHMREARHVGKIVLEVPRRPEPEETILVTGATGALGGLLARHLAEGGSRRLLLASRRGPDAPGAQELLAGLRDLGATVDLVACDLAGRDSVEALLSGVHPDHPLGAVLHLAGVLDDGVVGSLDPDRLAAVMGPKADGALHLDELTRGMDLAWFVMFSSVASTLGAPGQGSYAAANSVLDSLAHRRRAEGLPATAIAWGAWEEGMAGDVDQGRFRRAGIPPLGAAAGLGLLERALASPDPGPVALALDPAALRRRAGEGALPPVLSSLAGPAARRRGAGPSLPRRLAAAPEEEWPAIVLELVRGHVAAVLGHGPGEGVDPDRSFRDLGLDSLGAVELRNRLGEAVGTRLPSTLVFDHPSCGELAGFLAGRVEADADSALPAAGTAAGGTLTGMIRRAHESDSLIDFGAVLSAASRFRPSFDATAGSAQHASIVSLAEGDLTRLVCVPSFVAGSGPHQFSRLAAGFGQSRAVSALTLPGFGPGRAVPASWDAAIGALAETVAGAVAHDAFVLVGYSIGGVTAHSVAARLERDGIFPAGVAMIDTLPPESLEERARDFAVVMGAMLEKEGALMAIDDDELMAMATYVRVLEEWRPPAVDAPRLLIRAGEPLGADREPTWQLPADVVEVDGTHFGLIENGAAATALVIDEWVRDMVDGVTIDPRQTAEVP